LYALRQRPAPPGGEPSACGAAAMGSESVEAAKFGGKGHLHRVEVPPRICVRGGGGVVFPLFGDAEQEWSPFLRAILYLLGLAWCFMGVAIISDVFMGSIEKITSKKKRLFDIVRGKFYTYEVWNATVANLTLMALGSSAPEILLNVIDIFAKEFFVEGLGPSTIVGSAAFNLLMIIAVCIIAIPSGEVRFIKEVPVYICTATFSVLAYLWLLVILLGSSPHVVEPWEGIATFLFFPLLISLAFAADKGWFTESGPAPARSSTSVRQSFVHDQMCEEEIAELEAQIRKQHGPGMTSEQVARFISIQYPPQHSIARYRVEATREMFAGKRVKLVSHMAKRLTSIGSQIIGATRSKRVSPEPLPPKGDPHRYSAVAEIDFHCLQYAVLENAGKVQVKIVRSGCEDSRLMVDYQTEDGDAKAHDDYIPQSGTIAFEAGQTEAILEINIVDDAAYEEDEDFYVRLSDPRSEKGEVDVILKNDKVKIVIIDDDDAGVISFPEDSITICPKAVDDVVAFAVERHNGSSGELTVNYTTEQESAVAGRDFVPTSGVLTFEDKQREAMIKVPIKAQGRYDTTDTFRIVLTAPTGGAKLDEHRDGGPTKNILKVTIAADDATRQRVDSLKALLQIKWEKSKIGHANWASQFHAAIRVNGGDDEESEEGEKPTPPSLQDYVMHFVTVPWKLLFALVPPVDYCDGWVCFCCSLFMIGVVTMIINDLASLLGCVMCIPDELTAITFVALGTSLPDMFASKMAAMEDPHADASVGNVTGSNSVNVFLGLGLPWMVASIHWAFAERSDIWHAKYAFDDQLGWLGKPGVRAQGFVVKAGSLAFSVVVFACCALSCIVLLAVRRLRCGGELGGPSRAKYASATFLTFLWFLYIGLSAWRSLEEEGGFVCST